MSDETIAAIERAFKRPGITDRQMELAHLRLADRHIAEGELRIAAQAALVERMRTALQPLGPAEDYLELLRDTMVEWERHRRMIVAALGE